MEARKFKINLNIAVETTDEEGNVLVGNYNTTTGISKEEAKSILIGMLAIVNKPDEAEEDSYCDIIESK